MALGISSLTKKIANKYMIIKKFPVILIDGASCSGKSTIKSLLINDEQLDLGYAKRHTTRKKRSDDDANRDYIFISEPEFRDMQKSDSFIESKDFLFGMSYGISWNELADSLDNHAGTIAIINLGNIEQAKASIPWALSILIDAPLENIANRLRKRKLNSEEQIEERLNSAKSVAQLRGKYDYVCANEDGKLETIYDDLKNVVKHYIATFNRSKL